METLKRLLRLIWNFIQCGISLKMFTWYLEDTNNGLLAFFTSWSIIILMFVLIDLNELVQENKIMLDKTKIV